MVRQNKFNCSCFTNKPKFPLFSISNCLFFSPLQRSTSNWFSSWLIESHLGSWLIESYGKTWVVNIHFLRKGAHYFYSTRACQVIYSDKLLPFHVFDIKVILFKYYYKRIILASACVNMPLICKHFETNHMEGNLSIISAHFSKSAKKKIIRTGTECNWKTFCRWF